MRSSLTKRRNDKLLRVFIAGTAGSFGCLVLFTVGFFVFRELSYIVFLEDQSPNYGQYQFIIIFFGIAGLILGASLALIPAVGLFVWLLVISIFTTIFLSIFTEFRDVLLDFSLDSLSIYLVFACYLTCGLVVSFLDRILRVGVYSRPVK